MGNSANRTDRAAIRQERAAEVLRLRREERLTHEEIGKLFGINKSSAWALEQLGLDLLREKTIDQAQKWRKRLNTHLKAEVEDLHEMLDSWRGAAKVDPDALDKFVKVHAQLTSKYTVLARINGAIAPDVTTITVTPEATPAEARRLMREHFGGGVGPGADGVSSPPRASSN
jgi:hypothetical protein